MEFDIERTNVEAVRLLRHEVLRAGMPFESTLYPGDGSPLAAHYVSRVLTGGDPPEIVSIGTIFPDAPPWDAASTDAWRIRGMATKEGFRGRGLGRHVLDALLNHATEEGGTKVWCHARVGALEFYLRAGFVTVGEPFHDDVAMHQTMWRSLTLSTSARSPTRI